MDFGQFCCRYCRWRWWQWWFVCSGQCRFTIASKHIGYRTLKPFESIVHFLTIGIECNSYNTIIKNYNYRNQIVITCIRHRSRKFAVFRRYLLNGAGLCFGFGRRGAFFRRSTSIRFCIDFVRKLYFAIALSSLSLLSLLLLLLLLLLLMMNVDFRLIVSELAFTFEDDSILYSISIISNIWIWLCVCVCL